jgi:hypothetical protein
MDKLALKSSGQVYDSSDTGLPGQSRAWVPSSTVDAEEGARASEAGFWNCPKSAFNCCVVWGSHLPSLGLSPYNFYTQGDRAGHVALLSEASEILIFGPVGLSRD